MNEVILLLLIVGAAYSIYAMHHKVLIPDISTQAPLADTNVIHNGIFYATPQITSVNVSQWVTDEPKPTVVIITYRITEEGLWYKYQYTYKGSW